MWAAENVERTLTRYQNLTKNDDWQIYQNLIINISNKIAQYMLSKEYSELDEREKDVQQRVFYMTKELFEFVLDPAKDARKANKIMEYNKFRETTFNKKKRPANKEKKHGWRNHGDRSCGTDSREWSTDNNSRQQ